MSDAAEPSGAPSARLATTVTSAIPYVNAPPHLGFAFELVLADAFARHRRERGEEVRFLTGADENSLKCVRAAEAEGLATEEFVRRNAERYRALREPLGLSSDDFLRTSAEPRHREAVAKLWRACARRGDLARRRYRGLYCVGCEAFLSPAELDGAGLCREHAAPPEPVEEENWFFRLSRYAAEIRRAIESGELRILPESARREALGFLRAGPEDVSVSRSSERARGWGIPVPGDPGQVVYVWFDALVSYVSALDYAGEGALWRRWWQGAGRRVHVIGRGITRFHALHWPAILLSAGLPLPTDLLVHGYVTVGGRKIGKSLGNAVDPVALAHELGTDALRYALLRHLRAGQDSDFTREALERARERELADQLGNLLQRVLALVERHRGGVVPEPPPATAAESALAAAADALPARVDAAFAAFRPHEGLAAIFEGVALGNRYVEAQAPWRIARSASRAAGERLDAVLHATARLLARAARELRPFLPATAREIERRLGARDGELAPGARVSPGPPLFPRRS